MLFFSKKHFFIFLALALLIAGCKTTETVTPVTEEPEPEEEVAPMASALLTEDDFRVYRSSLRDQFVMAHNEIDSVFALTEDDLRIARTNTGFRIQLLSTENIAEADSMMMAYYDWADGRRLPFDRTPEAYVLFRQPYYRVRVGDFRNRSLAIDYLNILRPHFHGAWIVIDTINPSLSP